MRDLLAPETVVQLRRIGAGASRGARHAAWALEAFDGDEERATAALVDERRVASARQSLASVRSVPTSAAYVPHWEREVTRLERLFAARPREPSVPADLVAWVYERLGLEQDHTPVALVARRVGRRRAFVGTAWLRGEGDPVRSADAVALANDLFPIGEGWVPVTLPSAEAELAHSLGHDLAYRTALMPEARARARARRFVALFGPDAQAFSSGQTSETTGADGRRVTSRWSSPLTHHTFDAGVAFVDARRAGVVTLVGED
jgi:hypothetical protein